MPPYRRDPLSVWFDSAAMDLLARAYARPGEPAHTYLQPPTRQRRAAAREIWGIDNLDERDKWGEIRWVRAFKRAVFWNHATYGYAEEFRPGDERAAPAAATSLQWHTGGLVRKAGWPTRRRLITITIRPGGAAAMASVRQRRRSGRRWDLNPEFASHPWPPDRPWEVSLVSP